MILMIVPPLMLLLGLSLGGRPAKLLDLPFHRGWLALVAFGAQWLLVRAPATTPPPLFAGLLLGTYGLLIVCLVLNRNLPGMRLALAGAVCNFVVLLANGGLMPITPAALTAAHLDRPAYVLNQRLPNSKDILVAPERAQLAGLGDSLVLSLPYAAVISPGDVLVATGLGGLVLLGMEPRWRRRRAPAGSGVSTATVSQEPAAQ